MSVSPIHTRVSPAMGLGALGGNRVPVESAGVLKCRPVLSISSAQNGSVPSTRSGSAVETFGDVSTGAARFVESPGSGGVSRHAPSSRMKAIIVTGAPNRRPSSRMLISVSQLFLITPHVHFERARRGHRAIRLCAGANPTAFFVKPCSPVVADRACQPGGCYTHVSESFLRVGDQGLRRAGSA